jgi:hypothetical protein
VQQVGIDRERGLAALVLGDRNLVGFGIGQERGAAAQIPFTPGRNPLMDGSSALAVNSNRT